MTSFRVIPTTPGVVISELNLDAGQVSVVIDRGVASLMMSDRVTGARTSCVITADLLLSVAGLMTEAAERLADCAPDAERVSCAHA